MSSLWIGAVSLHVLAAIVWIGGMVFLSLVLAPVVRKGRAIPEYGVLFRTSALRFRLVVWGAMSVLLVTGPFLLAQRNISVTNPATWPPVVAVKLGLVAGLFLFTFSHDLFLGPKVVQIMAIPVAKRTAWEQALVGSASWLPRLSLLIALAVIVAAAILSRS